MSGSATPRASTRLRMISMAVDRSLLFALCLGWSTTEAPPWRSRPRFGVVLVAIVVPNAPAATSTMKMRVQEEVFLI